MHVFTNDMNNGEKLTDKIVIPSTPSMKEKLEAKADKMGIKPATLGRIILHRELEREAGSNQQEEAVA